MSALTALEACRTLPAKTVEWFFDYTCPFAYLASTQIASIAARMGVSVTYKPILLGGVFRAVGTAQNLSETLSPAKAAHSFADQQRWARRFGVPLRMPQSHPMRSVDALRATLACGIAPAVVDGFYRAYWVENRDIARREVISDVLARAGQDAARVIEAMGSAAIKDELRVRTDEAIARGVFGVPTFIVDGEHLYWGQDRIDFVVGVRTPAPQRPPPAIARSRRLSVYWDFSSPFGYLASTQVDALARRTGAQITWRPVLLGGLFRAIGTPDVPIATFSAAKQRFYAKDLERWAERWGVPYRFPSGFPVRSLKALRVYLALPEALRAGFRERTFLACWFEDRNIESEEVLAAAVGDDAAAREALVRSESREIKDVLRASTEEAAARGVFGVPTFIVEGPGLPSGGELFWGQDRIDLVEEALTLPEG